MLLSLIPELGRTLLKPTLEMMMTSHNTNLPFLIHLSYFGTTKSLDLNLTSPGCIISFAKIKLKKLSQDSLLPLFSPDPLRAGKTIHSEVARTKKEGS